MARAFVITHFVQLVDALRGNPLALPVFVALYAGACFIAPISPFPVAGGVLFGFWGGLAVNLGAVLLGASGSFWLARRLGHRTMAAFLRRWGNHGWASLLRDPGPGTFVLVRWIGFPPFVITNYLAGLSQMPWGRFLWTSLIGLLPWTFLMTYFSGTLWSILREAGVAGFHRAVADHLGPLLAGVGILAGTALLGVWARRRLGLRNR